MGTDKFSGQENEFGQITWPEYAKYVAPAGCVSAAAGITDADCTCSFCLSYEFGPHKDLIARDDLGNPIIRKYHGTR